MNEAARSHSALSALLAEALKVADELGLELVAIRIAEAIDHMEREEPAV